MAEAIVSIVVGRLTDLLIEDAQLLQGVKDEIQQVVTELRRIKTFLRDADSRISEYNIRILLAEIRELAYDAEHVVESFLVKTYSSPGKTIQWMNTWKFSRKIKDIQRKMSVIYDFFGDYNIRSTLDSPESSDSSQKLKRFHTFATVEPDIFVGFYGDVDRLVGHLVDESDGCYPLISICGMGGLGKTTMAEKIYNHSTIKNHFAGLAWVTISQKWQAKHLWQKILLCLVHDNKEEIFTWDDNKLVENLLQIQEKKKCLIVLDDIWSNDAWDSIKAAFTAEKSLSKLMLTSRNVDVAEYVNPKGHIHQPGFFSADQSWELLQLKALPTRGDYLAYRILRYLKGTPGKGLMFKRRDNLQIEVYTDADWAGSITDARSTSGYCTFIGGNLVTCRSKKQSVVARSSAEAELRSLANGICEAIWIKRLLEELKIPISFPIKIYCDNKAAISIAHNPVLHDKTKHIEVDKHFIKEKIESGLICISYVPTTQQTADILTKGLLKRQFELLVSKLAMEDIYKPA